MFIDDYVINDKEYIAGNPSTIIDITGTEEKIIRN